MKNKIELHGLYRNGWNLFVPATMTCRFIEFLRQNKTAATIDMAASPKGSLGENALDCFVLDRDYGDQTTVEGLVAQFQTSLLS